MEKLSTIEIKRLKLQKEIDARTSAFEKNVMGQFATPTKLARDILSEAKNLLPRNAKVLFLDPAFGTGSFYSALLDVFPQSRIERAEGFEIDSLYGKLAKNLWGPMGLKLQIKDFTKALPPEDEDGRFNLVICNPPYVRHHHIEAETKVRLQSHIAQRYGTRLSGLAGLYCHFLMMSVEWMTRDGIAGWLIPSEFMDVNYGRELKKFLLENVTLLRIHRFDPTKVQFGDALVSSAVVWFRNTPPPPSYEVEFSFDGNLLAPSLKKRITNKILEKEAKWTRFPLSSERTASNTPVLADFFKIKRGVATGNNGFFILTSEQIREKNLPKSCFKPILPSPRFLAVDEILSESDGTPRLDKKLFLLDCSLTVKEIKDNFPRLWEYLRKGEKLGVTEGYICSNRKPWYSQESRPSSPFICTYIGRSDNGHKPFRFVLNHSQAIVTNTYLILYPKPEVAKAIEERPEIVWEIWRALTTISGKAMLEEGRVYGGGLHKIEPRELGNVPASSLMKVFQKKAISSDTRKAICRALVLNDSSRQFAD